MRSADLMSKRIIWISYHVSQTWPETTKLVGPYNLISNMCHEFVVCLDRIDIRHNAQVHSPGTALFTIKRLGFMDVHLPCKKMWKLLALIHPYERKSTP